MTEDGRSVLVIFGITGDLARRKLLPALYHLFRDNLLHPDTKIVGVTRQDISRDGIMKELSRYTVASKKPSPAALHRFGSNFDVLSMDMSTISGYRKLKAYLDRLDASSGQNHARLYYLSVPPAVVDEVSGLMAQAGLNRPKKGVRLPALLLEKPFGYDLVSAEELVKSLKRHYREEQLYRIDHYLAKEVSQNLLDIRFQNDLLENVWNRGFISRVEITAHEAIGIEGRVNFYEQTGALRDLIQSHLLQLMALVGMERPRLPNSAAHIQRRRLELLRQIVIPGPDEVARTARRGQYHGYREVTGRPDSTTETYALVKLAIDNERWKGVPFTLRTGKATGSKLTEIVVHFGKGKTANRFVIRLQPEEEVSLSMQIKTPGHSGAKETAKMDFSYSRSYPLVHTPEAYERVLLDALNGQKTVFSSSDEVIQTWKIITPILDEWQKSGRGLIFYTPATLENIERKYL